MLETLENIGQLENIFDETNNVRQQLEDVLRLNPDDLPIKQRLSELSSWVELANTTNDLSIKFKIFYALSNLTTELTEKYPEIIPKTIRDQLDFFAKSAIARGKINQAIQTILEGSQTNSDGSIVVGIEKLSTAIIFIAEAVDNYWLNLSSEVHERVKKLVIGFLEIESEIKFQSHDDRIKFNTNKQVLKHTASYIMWKIEQLEKEEKTRIRKMQQ